MPARKRARSRTGNEPLVYAGRSLAAALFVTLALVFAFRWPLPVAWLVGASVTALALYGYDKRAAQKRHFRVPEWLLLGLALLGGSPGALLGMVVFRHKTRKGRFLAPFLGVLLLQVGAVLIWRFLLAEAMYSGHSP